MDTRCAFSYVSAPFPAFLPNVLLKFLLSNPYGEISVYFFCFTEFKYAVEMIYVRSLDNIPITVNNFEALSWIFYYIAVIRISSWKYLNLISYRRKLSEDLHKWNERMFHFYTKSFLFILLY